MDGDREQGSIIDLKILKESFINLKLNPARTILEFQLGWILTQSPVFQIYREWTSRKLNPFCHAWKGLSLRPPSRSPQHHHDVPIYPSLMCILKRSLVLGFILGQIWRRIIVRWVLLIGYLELPSLSNKLQLSPSLDHAYCHRPSSMSMAIPYRHNRTRPHNLKLDSIQLMQPESLTPSPNLGESRESQLNADELPQNNTNMQDVDMQNVDEGMNDNYEYDDNNGNSNSDDNANGSDSHPPSPPSSSPPLPSSTSPPDSSELMLIQHQNNGWSTKNAAYKSKQMNA